MIYIDRLEDYEEYYLQGMQNEQLLQKSSTETLPTEVLSKIFSYLGEDLQRVTSVNERLCEVAIGTAKHQNLSAIQSFVNFICNNLKDSHIDQKKQLLDIANGTKILNSVNLYQVKSSLNEVKETLLNVLKNLDVPDLENLEELSKNEAIPLFFDDFFFLAKIYKRVDEANTINNPLVKSGTLGRIVDALLENGKTEEATEIANMIPYDSSKSFVLLKIVDALLKKGKIEEATKLMNMIPLSSSKSLAVGEIVAILLKDAKIEEATEIVNIIPLQARSWALQKIANFRE